MLEISFLLCKKKNFLNLKKRKKEALPKNHSLATCPEFLLLFKHTPYLSLILSLESPIGKPQLSLPLAFLCPFLLLFLPLLLG